MKVSSKDFDKHTDTREMLKSIKDKQWEEIRKKHKNKPLEKED